MEINWLLLNVSDRKFQEAELNKFAINTKNERKGHRKYNSKNQYFKATVMIQNVNKLRRRDTAK